MLLSSAPEARAEEGLSLTAGLGWSAPVGDIATDAGNTSGLRDLFSGGVPVSLGVAWRFSSGLAVGAYGQYTFAALASDAKAKFPGGKGRDIRVGVEATYALASTGAVAPWFGLGAGWEWAQVSWTESGVDATSGFDGPEATLQGGADWRVSEALAVGPFVSLTIGEFRSLSAKGGGREITVEINSSDREIHEWLQVGLRGRFDL
jgi:hypothetical protein